MTTQPPHEDVLYVSVGAPEHGVVRHARCTAQALERIGVRVETLHASDATSFLGFHETLHQAADAGMAVHLDVTDALFGPSAEAAASVLTSVVPASATVTLHDVPQPAEGEERFRRRAAAYRRVAEHVAGVVVSSAHERALLRDVVDVDAAVVPLPVEDRRSLALARRRPLPDSLAGLEQDVVVFGFLYPGKGHAEALSALGELHRQWGEAAAGLPRRVTALGPASVGHGGLVHELTEQAESLGLEFRVTGYVPDELADSALLAAGIPFAAHRNVSASGSLASWTSVGRRAIVPTGRYVEEMEWLRPGTLRVVGRDAGPDLCYALCEALAEAVEDPDRTWIAPDADLHPGPEDCARLLADVWARVHGGA